MDPRLCTLTSGSTGEAAAARAHAGRGAASPGCKKNHIGVCYTPWSNLRKTGDMDVGQVGFHTRKLVRHGTRLERAAW